MFFMSVLKPNEILEVSIDAAVPKAKAGVVRLLVLGFLAGAFIAFAAETSNMAAFNLLLDPNKFGLGRVLAGAVFGVGLVLVIIAGGELFTGNTLMIGGVIRRKISAGRMLRNWGLVYLANFVGSVFIAWLMSETGLFSSGGDALGAATIRIAAGKTALAFHSAFFLGILCNWLVCLGVWLSYAADTMGGKIVGIMLPVWLFVTSGFEHSVANMYYIPAGIFAKSNPAFLAKTLELGTNPAAVDGLNWGSFFTSNLIPVTLGNIVGGCVFVSMAYLAAHHTKKNVE
jgi:formate/nitrite transporter